MGRFFLWFGDQLNRLHRRFGPAYSVAVFGLIWLVLTLIAHFGGAEGSPMAPHRWAAAAALGLVGACICTLAAQLFSSGR